MEPEKEKDMPKVGVEWKPSTGREVQKYIDRNITFQNIIFQLVYKVRLVKFGANGEEEREVAFFHSGNKMVLDMYHFDTVCDEQIKEINEDFETYISEKTIEWKMDLSESEDLLISRYKPLSGPSYIQKLVEYSMKW